MKQEFKIGDTVRCIQGGSRKAAGWMLNKTFKIRKFNCTEKIAWPLDGTISTNCSKHQGVYIESLELVFEPFYSIY